MLSDSIMSDLTNTTNLTRPSNTMAVPIKVLATTTIVRECFGSQHDYLAREFIGICEDVTQKLLCD